MSILKRFGVLVLAAGSSSRLGSPKQLLSYQDKSLLDITIEAAKNIKKGPVVVILGGNYDLIKHTIDHSTVHLVYNANWAEGLSSSISLGMDRLTLEDKDLDGVILTVCDQPFLTGEILEALIIKGEASGKSIVASSYAATLGVPVLFYKCYFNELSVLKGREGAKALIFKYKNEVASVPFEKGEIDIDTPDDYTKLISGL